MFITLVAAQCSCSVFAVAFDADVPTRFPVRDCGSCHGPVTVLPAIRVGTVRV